MIARLCLMVVLMQPVAGLMCYFCADSSSENGHNQCQTWHRTMKYYRKKAETTGTYRTDKYVKNCTDYGDENKEKFCMVAFIEERKNVRSFIRDCSDGSFFFSSEIDKQFQGDIIIPDNQTTCRYTGQGYLACVTLCGSTYGFGHYCNGPLTTSASAFHAASICLVQAFVILVLLNKNSYF